MRFFAMGRPMMPSPMTVMLLMMFLRCSGGPVRCGSAGFAGGGREDVIFVEPVECDLDRRFVLEADVAGVAEFLAARDPRLEGQFAGAGSAPTGIVGDLDVAERRCVGFDHGRHIIAVGGEMVE